MRIEIQAAITMPGKPTHVVLDRVSMEGVNVPVTALADIMTNRFADMLDRFEETVISEIHDMAPYQMTLEDYS